MRARCSSLPQLAERRWRPLVTIIGDRGGDEEGPEEDVWLRTKHWVVVPWPQLCEVFYSERYGGRERLRP